MNRFRIVLFVFSALASFHCQSPAPEKKIETPPPASTETVTLPALAPIGDGYRFSLEETASSSEKVKKTGMQVESRETATEIRARWAGRILRQIEKMTEIEIQGEIATKPRNAPETKSVEPDEVCLTALAEGRLIREIVPAARPTSDALRLYATEWNLAHRLEMAFAGQTFTSGKEATLAPDLYELLLQLSLRAARERFLREKGHELQASLKCVFKRLQGGAAVFEFELDRKSEARLGHMKESGRGSFGLDPKTGRLRFVEMDASFSFDENQFYEVVDVARSGHARIVVGEDWPPAEETKTYDLHSRRAAGDKVVAIRYRYAPGWDPGRPLTGDPLVGYSEEVQAAGDELRIRRRYIRCGDDDGTSWDLEAVGALEGRAFTVGIGPAGAPKFERRDGDEKMFAWLGRDPLVDAWLPKSPVALGDAWTREDLPKTPAVGNHAALLAVRATPRPTAILGVFDKSPYPWEGAKPVQGGFMFVLVDIASGRIACVERADGRNATVYTPVPALDWKQRPARELVIEKIKADLARARSLESAGQTEPALEVYRRLYPRMTSKAALFEKDLETLWTLFAEAEDGDAVQSIAQALLKLKRTEARYEKLLHSQFLARNWRGLGVASEQFAKEYPKRPEGYLYQSIPKMNQRKFGDALKLLDEGLKILDAEASDSASELRPRLLYWAANAHLNMGDFAKAHELLEAAFEFKIKGKERKEMLDLMSRLMEAEKLKIYIDFREPDVLPLGMYHLMSEKSGPLPPFIDLHIINGSDEDKVIVFTSEVVDVTYPSTDQVLVPGRKEKKDGAVAAPFNMRIYQTPPLRKDFNVNSIMEEIERPIRIVVKEKTDQGDRLILERTIPVALWPRTRITILRWDKESTGDTKSMEKALASWVTPRSPFVEAFIRDAKKLLPEGVEFLGGAGIAEFTAREQVRAMYDYLKSRGMSYVGYTSGTDRNCFYQDVRLPAHVYRTANSLCIEGTVLFASLMEGMGLQPIIVLRPGHAFVGWRDPNGPIKCKFGQFYVLETTSVGRHDFETALSFAETDFERWRQQLENPVNWNCRILDIAQLRREGYKPQPYPEE